VGCWKTEETHDVPKSYEQLTYFRRLARWERLRRVGRNKPVRFATGLSNPDHLDARIATIWRWNVTSNNVLCAMPAGNNLLNPIYLRMSMDGVGQGLWLINVETEGPEKLRLAGAIRMTSVK
jgi:hypothetical protein